VITGALGGLWVVGWLWYTRGSGDELKGVALPIGTALRLTGRILGRRAFWMLAVSAIVINSANFYLADWIPLYLKSSRGFAFAAGNILSIAVYAGISSGNILVGLFVRKMVDKGLPVYLAKRRALLVSCVFMSMAVPAGFTPYRYLALVCLVLTGAGVEAFWSFI